MLRVELPLVPPSLNEWYSGGHWKKRKRLKDVWRWTFKALYGGSRTLPPLTTFPLRVIIQSQFKTNRKRDVGNFGSVAEKLIMDCLVSEGVIPDDNADYVQEVVYKRPLVGKDEITVCVLEAMDEVGGNEAEKDFKDPRKRRACDLFSAM